ncbi:hypothetical protein, partial [Streptomyces sp. MBT33]|uniref:hypothetical protein n=1 Tax=Streptomyces sp. MBT33 TaxID=1488363 RepID=UPI00190D2A09
MSASAPQSAEVPFDVALNSVLRWIDRPRDSSAWVWLGGTEGTGKSELLREVAGRHPDALCLDCAGMHCEEIARELADSFGVASPGTYRDNFARVNPLVA